MTAFARSRQALALAMVLVGAPALAASAAAQPVDAPRFGLGYVVNAPDQMVGAAGYMILPVAGGWGLYLDAKFHLDSPRDDIAFRADLTGEEVRTNDEFSGARFLKQEFTHRSVNAALVRPLNPRIFVYAGGGLAWGENYKLYEQIIGELGYALWVADPAFDDRKVNLMGGLILRVSSFLSSQIGYETHPKGVTAGISLRLPRW